MSDKFSQIIQKVALKNQYPEKEVQKIVHNYFKLLRLEINKIKHFKIQIENLGSFDLNKKKLKVIKSKKRRALRIHERKNKREKSKEDFLKELRLRIYEDKIKQKNFKANSESILDAHFQESTNREII